VSYLKVWKIYNWPWSLHKMIITVIFYGNNQCIAQWLLEWRSFSHLWWGTCRWGVGQAHRQCHETGSKPAPWVVSTEGSGCSCSRSM
jgi:hypothetical protein